MDIMTIMALIAKGISVAELAMSVGKNALPAIEVIKNLVVGAQAGTVTDEMLADVEAQLDAMIDEFNKPIT